MKLQEIVRDLYGVDQPQGCTEEEIAAMKERFGAIPAVVEDFWRTFGRTKELTRTDDTWFFPEDFQRWDHLAQSGDLPLLDENQYVCEAVVLQKDLSLPDPPVYTRMAADEGPWVLSAPTVSEFLKAVLTYEAIWQMDHSSEEFYWLTDEELATVQAKLTKRSAVLRNWMEMEITFYSSRPDNLVVIMDVGGQYQTLYGGNTEGSYAALLEVMEGLGEPI